MTFPALLKEIADEHDVGYAAILDSSGNVVVSAGDPAVYPAPGLISALLGPYGDPRATFNMLDGQLLPQVFAQGNYHAILDKPNADLVTVLFLLPEAPSASPTEAFLARYQRGRELCDRIRKHLGSPFLVAL